MVSLDHSFLKLKKNGVPVNGERNRDITANILWPLLDRIYEKSLKIYMLGWLVFRRSRGGDMNYVIQGA